MNLPASQPHPNPSFEAAHGAAAHSAARRESAMGGTARTFVAELLVVPSGLLVAALLSRRLSLDDYGVFTLAITFITWLEWSLSSLFARSTIKLVSEADDARAVCATVLRTYAATSVVAALALAAGADLVALALREPRLVAPLRLLALDVPLFCLAQAHRNILIGLGRFKARAFASAVRWISRAALIATFVLAGFGVEGAILGAISASLCELVVCRRAAPLSLKRSDFAPRALWQMALPLLGCALALRLFDKIDLFMLSACGGTTAVVALYGAAQNLALAPGIFALAFSPTLLSSVARAQREGDMERAQRQGRDALRAAVLLSPIAALVSAAAPDIIVLFFGARFASAAPLLALLIWGATAIALVSICNALLLAFNRIGWALGLLVPLILLAPLAQWQVIPIYGAVGAAGVTLILGVACALANVVAVKVLCDVSLSPQTVCRAGGVSGAVWLAATTVGSLGWWLVPKLVFFMVAIGTLLWIAGEWQPREKAWIGALWKMRRGGQHGNLYGSD